MSNRAPARTGSVRASSALSPAWGWSTDLPRRAVASSQRSRRRVTTTSCATSASGLCPATERCQPSICWWTLRSRN